MPLRDAQTRSRKNQRVRATGDLPLRSMAIQPEKPALNDEWLRRRWFCLNRAIGILITICVFTSVVLHAWRWWTGTPRPPKGCRPALVVCQPAAMTPMAAERASLSLAGRITE